MPAQLETSIHLIRHVATTYSETRRVAGRSNPRPSTHGERQIPSLAQTMDGVDLSAIYYSPLRRTTFTAQELASSRGRTPVAALDELVDRAYGEHEGREWSSGLITHWRRAYPHRRDERLAPNIEPYVSVEGRVTNALTRIAQGHSGEAIAVVTSADCIGAFLQGNGLVDSRRPFDIRPAGHAQVVFDGRAFRLKGQSGIRRSL